MRHRRLLLLAAAALAACSRRTGDLAPRSAVDTADDARAGYERACGSCHGTDGRGRGPVAPALRTPPADLTVLAVQNGGVFPRETVVAVVTGAQPVTAHGTREMPVWALRYEPTDDPATAAAALVARRRLEMLVDYVAAMQIRAPVR